MENQKAGFDRNQLIGLLLIVTITVGFGWWQSANIPEVEDAPPTEVVEEGASTQGVNAEAVEMTAAVLDSNGFVAEEISIENDDLKLTYTTLGAQLVRAQIKGYQTYDSAEVLLVNSNQVWDIKLPGDVALSIKEFNVVSHNGTSLILSDGATDVKVSLEEAGFVASYTVNGTASAVGKPELFWERTAYRTEKGISNERIYSTYSYKVQEDGDVDNLSGRGGDKSKDVGAVNWLAQKQHFFSYIVQPEGGFASATVATVNGTDANENIVKVFSSNSTLNQSVNGAYSLPFSMYLGPNHYQTLKKHDRDYEKVINFGWGIFGWIGRGVVVPIFNWLDGYGWNYGVIILIMVLIIKGTLSPLTFASYRSMAKMRVLKPQIEAINEKFGDKDAMGKQQAQMALYRETGVKPLGGCIPILVQMPILFAMFRFFPASIELRGQSFLWATDLSTYDALISWESHIPIWSTVYGNHISIFTLLMTGSTILYTRMNQSMTASTGNAEQMKQMQMIMYLMPLIFMFVLNSYPAGLTYYYFLSNIVTFGMQWAIRRSLNDEAILAKIEAKKAQPKKQSKFQARLEEMQRQQNLNRSQRRK